MTPDEKAALILRALSGQHLYGFLPGNDHKVAIGHAVSGYHGWGEPSGLWGQVTRKGIGLYPDINATRDEKNAEVLLPWRDVLDVVAKGCGDGRRDQYESAFAAWNEHHRRFEFRYWDLDECKRRRNRTPEEIQAENDDFARVSDGIHDTTAAIIRAGCDRQTLQPELF